VSGSGGPTAIRGMREFKINVVETVQHIVCCGGFAASPQCIWMSRTALQGALHGLAHCRDEGSSFSQCLYEPP